MTIVYDPTGTAPSNLIVGETHVVTEPDVFSNQGPFYRTGLVVTGHLNNDNTLQTLDEFVDYVMSPLFSQQSADTGKEVYSYIVLIDYAKWEDVILRYQAVGGDPDQVLLDEIIAAGNFDRTNVNNWLSFIGDIVSINTIGADHNLKNTSVAFLFASKLNYIALALQTPSTYITFINGAFAAAQDDINTLQSQVASIIADINNNNIGDFVTSAEMDAALIDLQNTIMGDTVNLLAANKTIYVTDTPTGTQDGLTAGTAVGFAAGWKLASALNDNGYQITIRLLDGSYTDITLSNAMNSPITILGNTTTPANVTINGTVTVSNSIVTFSGIKFINTTTGNCIKAINYAQITIGSDVVFGQCADAAHMGINYFSKLTINNPYTVIGDAPRHLGIHSGSQGIISSELTLSGTRDFIDTFVWITNATCTFNGATFVGTATGSRFKVANLGLLDVNGVDPDTLLPGNTAGTTSSATFGLVV